MTPDSDLSTATERAADGPAADHPATADRTAADRGAGSTAPHQPASTAPTTPTFPCPPLPGDLRFVALGDSFTEGVGDERADGTPRGWSDRVAESLAADAAADGHTVHYANFAVRGRLLEAIVSEQLEAALALDPLPTLISLNGGGNDMLRPAMDVLRLVDRTVEALDACRAAGVHVLLLAGPDPSAGLPMTRLVRRRGQTLTEHIAPLRHRAGVTFVDLFHDRELGKEHYWSTDRLHLNPSGHRRAADLVVAGLRAAAAVAGPRGAAFTEIGPGRPRGLRNELRYYREFVTPWVNRRLTGRSSGDGRAAKQATWQLLDPQAPEAAY